MKNRAWSRTKYLCLFGFAGAALSATALLVKPHAAKPARPTGAVTPIAEPTAHLELELARLEQQVSELRRSNGHAQDASPSAPNPPSSVSVPAPKSAADEPPELGEEHSNEQARQRIDRRYALLERRFAEEPFDESGVAAEEESVRSRIRALDGYQLLKLECRYTMCRIEVKADVTGAPDVMAELGLSEGGETRRRDDGTFLIFAGRQGFPFQEVNRAD